MTNESRLWSTCLRTCGANKAAPKTALRLNVLLEVSALPESLN